MGFSTNYEDVTGDYGILPEGDYEVIIRNIEERTTKSGATGLNLSLVVRNDINQKYKDRYIFYTLWKRKEPTQADMQVQGYSFKQVMRLAKSAKLPNGKSYESIQDMCSDLMHRTLKVNVEHRGWNGKQQENVKYVNESDFPDCRHVFKEKAVQNTQMQTSAAPSPDGFNNLDDFEEIISDGEVPF